MSLLFVIDAYNIINHPIFIRCQKHNTKDRRHAFLEFIRIRKLTGAASNRVIVVFDGYPDSGFDALQKEDAYFDIIFSRKENADNRIKAIIEGHPNPRTMIVVSDDKEIRFYARSAGSKVMSAEEFLGERAKGKKQQQEEEPKKHVSFSDAHRINEELKKIWLK